MVSARLQYGARLAAHKGQKETEREREAESEEEGKTQMGTHVYLLPCHPEES